MGNLQMNLRLRSKIGRVCLPSRRLHTYLEPFLILIRNPLLKQPFWSKCSRFQISLVFQDVVRMLSSLQLAAVEAGVSDRFGMIWEIR